MLNNHVNNLQWVTHSENIRHRKYSPSKETRQKVSKALKGYKHTEESCKNMSDAMLGHKVSEETKLKISETVKALPFQKF